MGHSLQSDKSDVSEVDITEEGRPPMAAAENNAANPQLQEVSEGHRGTGVHMISLTATGSLEAREYAVPIARHAKRKRGPNVTAPSLLLARHGEGSAEVRCSNGQYETNDNMLPERPSEKQALKNSVPNNSALSNFQSGGHLRTVSSQ